MFKLFRRIRQNLLNKNKVGKYLLYAFGEIILVVIGILIALNLNQRSEQKKTEAKIDAIFEDVLKDLITDINESTKRIIYFRRRDSLLSLVLNTNLSYDDYANEDSYPIWRVANTHYPYDITDNAYSVLMNNIDAIPEKYDHPVALLNKLYGPLKRNFENTTAKLEAHVETSNDMLVEMPWFTYPDFKKSKEAIEYHLNDYHYKNRVKKYHIIAIRNLNTHIVRYRAAAIESYEEIASILNKPVDALDFIINSDELHHYVGNYRSTINPEQEAELLINENGFLKIKRTNPLREDELRHISSKTIFSSYNTTGGVFTFRRSNSGEVISMTIHEGHIPMTYTKLKSLL
ncbi:hypothetical protein NA63_2704 [Flavobacteriaceae bacterium MAR_2010_105]|nr:hypothetical protein NA63_2704 [Flavobacteriaceae bacterium MAR_2010_105]